MPMAEKEIDGSINLESNNHKIHVVQPGENLSMIARKYYGKEHEVHWITLHNFNREVIGENPDILQVGMKLIIPDIAEFLSL
jgi:nucleoid-associated protein YgaU